MKLHKQTCLIRSGATCNCGAVETKVRPNIAERKPLSAILADREYWRIKKLMKQGIQVSQQEYLYTVAKQQARDNRKGLRYLLYHDNVKFEGGMA